MSDLNGAATFAAQPFEVDDGWSRCPHGLFTAPGLNTSERLLLQWLWSHTPSYLAKLSVGDVCDQFGDSARTRWLKTLEALGYVVKTRPSQRKPAVFTLQAGPWRALFGHRGTVHNALTQTDDRTKCTDSDARNVRTQTREMYSLLEEQGGEQLEDSPLPKGKKPAGPHNAKAREILDAWWLKSRAETGNPPTAQPYPAVMKITEALLAVYDPAVVKHALVDANASGTVSIGSCEIAIKRRGGKPLSRPHPTIDRAELNRQADERERRADELFAAGRPTFKPLPKVDL